MWILRRGSSVGAYPSDALNSFQAALCWQSIGIATKRPDARHSLEELLSNLTAEAYDVTAVWPWFAILTEVGLGIPVANT